MGEDAFSIRVMDLRQRLQGYAKQNLKDIIKEDVSLMPEFSTARLNENDLHDLLSFLNTLRTPAAAPAGRGGAAPAGRGAAPAPAGSGRGGR